MDLHQVKKETILAVRNAAALIQEYARNLSGEEIDLKSLNNLVTKADKEAERSLVQDLGNVLPGSSFLAEEGTGRGSSASLQWIIDPIDGTTNFVHGVPCYAISVALADQENVILGVVHDIVHDKMYSAIRGEGAFANEVAIRVSSRKDMADTLVATGFPYDEFYFLDEYMDFLRYLMRHTRGIRRLGSAALDLCYVAEGIFDVFFEYGLAPWDVAAGGLIVEEAGGKVIDFKGGNDWLKGMEIIAGNLLVTDDFRERMAGFFKTNGTRP